ncbi:hypothetical protein BC830DRAFT_769458 [Chytriomyces sp. MP71]|nr:hypothetical protein BC830DRAFT_769458 [Chytriomyces sp. MP71]
MNRCIPEPPDTSTTEETRSRLVINDDTDQSLSDIDNETVSDSDDSDYFPSPIGVPPSSSIRPKTAHTTGNHEASSKQSRHASLSLDQRSKSAKPHDFTRRKLSAAPAQRISQEDLDRLSKPVVHIPPPVVKSRPTPTSKLPPASPSNEHKRYSSVYPCANRLLAKRWDDAARKRHHDKLATMKTYIDSKPPQAQGHLKERAKKLHMEDQKLSKIERENHILLARMVRQMSVVQGFTGLDSDLKVKVTAARPTPSARKKKELLEQIDESNQILMQRVEARRPHYRASLASPKDTSMFFSARVFLHLASHNFKSA